MAVDLKALRTHPGRNPAYGAVMKARQAAQAYNRTVGLFSMPKVAVPKQPNKYVPHQGSKERARHAKNAVVE